MVVNAFRFGKLSQKIKFSFSKKFSAAAVNSSLMSSFKKIGLRTVSNISEISPSSILLLGRSECARLGLLRILETVPTAGETNIFEGMEEDEDEVWQMSTVISMIKKSCYFKGIYNQGGWSYVTRK